MSVQGGSITYGRTKNLGDYNNVKGEATFAFENKEDLAEASSLALTAVGKLLGYEPVPMTKHSEPAADKPKKAKAEKKAETVTEEVPIGGAITTAPASAVEIDEDFSTPSTTAVPAISDEDIGKLCNAAAKRIGEGGGLKVRQLLMEVSGINNGGHIGSLTTPELRQVFVKKLAELK